jgi:hypothetical protein
MAEQKEKAFTDHVDNAAALDGANKAKKLHLAGLWPTKQVRGQEVIWNWAKNREATPEEIASAMKLTVKQGETPAEIAAKKAKEAAEKATT